MRDVAVLIIGFDGYKDVWDSYFELLEKYWSDRPKTYLATGELRPNYNNVTVISAGKDAEWSKKAMAALQQIEEEYVILLLEDFFTTTYVDNSKLMHIIKK